MLEMDVQSETSAIGLGRRRVAGFDGRRYRGSLADSMVA